MSQSLMAKSGDSTVPARTLVGHTRQVLEAVDAVFGIESPGTRLAQSWLRFFGLDEREFAQFRRLLRVSAAAHDWGKANDGFQGALKKDGEQVVYHEHLSGLLMADDAIRSHLTTRGLDSGLVLSAILSHHVRCAPSGEKALGLWQSAIRENLAVLSAHNDFSDLWRLVQDEIGAPAATPQFPTRVTMEELDKTFSLLKRTLNDEGKGLRDDQSRRSRLAAVRSALIVCDAVGSASERLPGEMTAWVRAAFEKELTGEFVWREVVKKRIAELRAASRWDDSGGVAHRDQHGFTEFQRDIASGGPRVLLTAPCGSGKTLAAWNWIVARLEERPAARVLFLYPTRATASEGFRDYVSWAPEADAGLFTGTAEYDLEGMFDSPDDPRDGGRYGVDHRLFALGHWTKSVVSATADQFLPFLQYSYGPLCRLPILAEAVVVIDEVHSFDRSMFATLKRFLNGFPSVPVLCMTATLAPERRADLVDGCKLVPLPDPPPADLTHVAGHPRYHLEWAARDQAEVIARDGLDSKKRVLWVSNRVDACRDVYHRLNDDDGYIGVGAITTLCYHSRFKAAHRRDRHNDVVQKFQAAAHSDNPSPIFAATTQVCEMSLDIDADVLVTDLAPIASLIQRMGRCNRDAKSMLERKRIGLVYVLEPEEGKEKPYEKEDLLAAKKFVDELHGREVSQAELECLHEKHDPRVVEPGKLCPFLDSGPYALAREESFREVDEYTVPSVLDDDLSKIDAALACRKPIDGFLIPVPRHLTREPGPGHSFLPRWVRVADGSRYDAKSGFDGRPRPQPDEGT